MVVILILNSNSAKAYTLSIMMDVVPSPALAIPVVNLLSLKATPAVSKNSTFGFFSHSKWIPLVIVKNAIYCEYITSRDPEESYSVEK